MEFEFYTHVYTHNLTLNLNVLKDYHIDAELMHQWGQKTLKSDVSKIDYPVTYYLNDNKNIRGDLKEVINTIKFTDKTLSKDKVRNDELINSLMFFCNEAEKHLLSVVFNDEDYNELVNIGKKLDQIASKKTNDLTVYQTRVDDIALAIVIKELTLTTLVKKFIRLAKTTKHNNINSIEDIRSFALSFKSANETKHLRILGYWADIIYTYLHNERLVISKPNGKLNPSSTNSFPLSNQQAVLIYTIFDLFNLTTKRKDRNVDPVRYIRNCVKNFEMFDWSK